MRWHRVLHFVLKALAYIGCAVGCSYQIVALLDIYFSFPSIVSSDVKMMDQLTLPAMTLCNNNRIMLSKLKDFDPDFEATWDILLEELRSRVNIAQTKVAIQHLLDRTVRNLMDSLSVNEFALLGYNWSDILPPDHFKCATDPFNLENKCLKYANIIQSAQEEGNCFTIFSGTESAFLKGIAIKSGLSQSPVIRGVGDALNLEISEQPFHPNEVFRVMVNFSIREYTTLNDKVAGQVVIHDQNELPPIRQRSFTIYPGHYYEFYVNKETDKYLPQPYVTDCVRYDAGAGGGQGNAVLSQQSCLMDCMANRTVALCNCWPPELPFILSSNTTERTLKWCSWRDGVNVNATSTASGNSTTSTGSTNWFRFCFAAHEPDCSKLCKLQCEVEQYTITKQSLVWPSNERMKHSVKYTKEYRRCCAIISLRFWSAEQTTLKYEPKYAFVEFSSYFGGLLSMWLGFSFVKSYDVFEAIGLKIIQRVRSHKGLFTALWDGKGRSSKASQRVEDGKGRPRVAKLHKTQHRDNSI